MVFKHTNFDENFQIKQSSIVHAFSCMKRIIYGKFLMTLTISH